MWVQTAPILSILQTLQNFFESFVADLDSLRAMIFGVVPLAAEYIGFLPSEVTAILGLGLSTLVVLRILGRD